MTISEKIKALEAVEMELCDWLDYANCIHEPKPTQEVLHYRFIEGFKDKRKYSFTFILAKKKRRVNYVLINNVIINADDQHTEQKLTCSQFHEWLKNN